MKYTELVSGLQLIDIKNSKPGSIVSGTIFLTGESPQSPGYKIVFILKRTTPSIILIRTDFEGNTFDYEPSSDGQIRRMDTLLPIKGIFILESIIAPEEPKTTELIQGTFSSVEQNLSPSREKAKKYIDSLRVGDNISLRSNSDGIISCFIVESELKTREGEKFSYIKLRSNNPENANKYAIIISSRGVFPDKINLGVATPKTENNGSLTYTTIRPNPTSAISPHKNPREFFSLVFPE